MCDNEEEILRLNQKIKELLWRVEQSMSRSSQLEAENKRLSTKVFEMKEICAQTSTINVQYKSQLEKEISMKEELLAGNAKLKNKVMKLSTVCHQQQEVIKVLQSNLRESSNASVRASRIPVKIIGSVSELFEAKSPKESQAYVDLEKKYGELESQYREALAVIDELEFELGDIDHLEMEVERLQQENAHLREMLQTGNDNSTFDTEASTTGHAINYAAAKADDEEEETHTGDFLSELQMIQKRKKKLHEKLENFHSRQSVHITKE